MIFRLGVILLFNTNNVSAQNKKVLKYEIQRLKNDSSMLSQKLERFKNTAVDNQILLDSRLNEIKSLKDNLLKEERDRSTERSELKLNIKRLSIEEFILKESTKKLKDSIVNLHTYRDSFLALRTSLKPVKDTFQTFRAATRGDLYIFYAGLISSSMFEHKGSASFKYLYGHLDGNLPASSDVWDGSTINIHERFDRSMVPHEINPSSAEGFWDAVWDWDKWQSKAASADKTKKLFVLAVKIHPSSPECLCCPDCDEPPRGFYVVDFQEIDTF
jgi:hypothetical protein